GAEAQVHGTVPPVGCDRVRLGLSGLQVEAGSVATARRAASSATSSFFESLPTAVLGRLSRNSSAAGSSWRPILSARKSRSASSVKGAAPALSLTKALAA